MENYLLWVDKIQECNHMKGTLQTREFTVHREWNKPIFIIHCNITHKSKLVPA